MIECELDGVASSADGETVMTLDKPVEKMNKEELQQECQSFRNIWSYIPDEMKYFLSKMGSPVIIIDRSNRRHFGRYIGFLTEWKAHKVLSVSLEYDVIKRKQYVEKGQEIVFASNIVTMNFLDERDIFVEPEPEQPKTGY